MSKQIPIEMTTRTQVLDLLNGLAKEYSEYYYRQYDALCEELEELKRQTLKTKAIEKLEAKVHEAQRAWNSKRSEMSKKVAKVRRLFQAHGLAPSVHKQVIALVEEANR